MRVVASGICHTDIVHKNMGFGPLPAVLGHEGAGVVTKVGAGVTRVKEGDHVVMSYASCGACSSCVEGGLSVFVKVGCLFLCAGNAGLTLLVPLHAYRRNAPLLFVSWRT